MRLNLNNASNLKNSLARLTRMAANDEIPLEKLRALTYSISHILSIQKHVDELEIEKRIDEIEQRLTGAGR